MTKQHTPTPGPYHVGTPNENEGEFGIHAADWIIADVCAIPGEPTAAQTNAAFIVRACNSHDALIQLAHDVAIHFAGTDSPLGARANKLVRDEC